MTSGTTSLGKLSPLVRDDIKLPVFGQPSQAEEDPKSTAAGIASVRIMGIR